MRWRFVVLAMSALMASSSIAMAAEPIAWAGLYAGAHGGYARGTADINTTLGPAASCGGGVVNCIAISNAESQPLNKDGFIGGFLAGYNFQSSQVVYGVEADFSGLSGSASRTTTQLYPVGGCCFTVSQSAGTDWIGTLRLRAGYAFDRALIYATGGLAFAHLKYNEQATDTANNIENTNISTVKMGWALGAGIEYALPNRWLVRGEYLHTAFGTLSADTPSSLTYVVATPLVYSHRVDFSHNIARAALIYRFGS